MTNVILLSTTTFNPHKTRRNRLPKTIRICLGKVKKSVVTVRKKSGKRKKILAVTMVARLVKIDEADFVFIIITLYSLNSSSP